MSELKRGIRGRPETPAALIERAEGLLREGNSVVAVGRLLRVSTSTLYDHGLRSPFTRGNRTAAGDLTANHGLRALGWEKVNLPIGDVLRDLRDESGLTQFELSRKLGVHHCTVSRNEDGNRDPTIENLAGYAKAFGIPVSRLVQLAEEMAERRATA
jgi:DNA-binding XRE family transcriptional regulator